MTTQTKTEHKHYDIGWSPKHDGCIAWLDEDGEPCCTELHGYFPTAEAAEVYVTEKRMIEWRWR